ncbi:hypothetical protein JAAARDRAFT_639124 [Jaapia argillacea MUCL 33604]|uniref:Uncharacterized protein n=1 Tax=Jaapia argillacea MUCL 33604 TaxID=933084 RepID=A0A067P717_9AGAM|nr:hypothetical protein JAAARDRAFT_639124 [Jaapia argillacea MUCL 33604]
MSIECTRIRKPDYPERMPFFQRFSALNRLRERMMVEKRPTFMSSRKPTGNCSGRLSFLLLKSTLLLYHSSQTIHQLTPKLSPKPPQHLQPCVSTVVTGNQRPRIFSPAPRSSSSRSKTHNSGRPRYIRIPEYIDDRNGSIHPTGKTEIKTGSTRPKLRTPDIANPISELPVHKVMSQDLKSHNVVIIGMRHHGVLPPTPEIRAGWYITARISVKLIVETHPESGASTQNVVCIRSPEPTFSPPNPSPSTCAQANASWWRFKGSVCTKIGIHLRRVMGKSRF